MKFGRSAPRAPSLGIPDRRALPVGDAPVAAQQRFGDQTRQDAAPVVDLRLLLLSPSHDEPSAQAWRVLLERHGVPFDCVQTGLEPLTMQTLAHAPGHGRYQGIVLATNSLVRMSDGVYTSSLTDVEWRVLRNYEHTFGIRRISAYATPSPEIGLRAPTWAGDLGDTVGSVTAAGKSVFGELVGPVPLSAGTYGFLAGPADDADFTSLVAAPAGAPIVGIVTHSDGREELVVTVASGPFSRHVQLLGPGMLGWVTRGRHLGHRDFYLSVQVDDVLLGAPVPLDAAPIRMTRDDVVDTARWSRDTGVRLDFAFNAWGSVTASLDGSPDPLTEALVAFAEDFNWLNHTFDHLDLDAASERDIIDEITMNLAWSRGNGISVEPDSLVTGAHSGLDNPALADASDACGVRWLASDASREGASRTLGNARTVPRHPVNIPLDVSTRAELVRRFAPGAAGATVGTIDRTEALAVEARHILDHLLSNDPRPHYAHQNALVDDRLLLSLLDTVLESFRELIAETPTHLSLAAAGQEIARRDAWTATVDSGLLTAVLIADAVEISNCTDGAVDVPYTTVSVGDSGIKRGHWISVPAGETVTFAR